MLSQEVAMNALLVLLIALGIVATVRTWVALCDYLLRRRVIQRGPLARLEE